MLRLLGNWTGGMVPVIDDTDSIWIDVVWTKKERDRRGGREVYGGGCGGNFTERRRQ